MNPQRRQKRRNRIRARISGTAERPRVSVYRSARAVDLQLVNDAEGRTLLSERGKQEKGQDKVSAARQAGKRLAERAVAEGVKKVVFDRGGYKYHGRVQAVAEGLREGGIQV